jgi:hypothetical protein
MVASKRKKDPAPRKPPARPTGRQEPGYWPRVIVKFHDHVELPYRDGAERALATLGIGDWDRLVKEMPGLTLRRLYTALEPAQIRALVERAKATDRDYDPPNLLTYFLLECPLGVAPDALVQALLRCPSVEKAYYDPPGIDPAVEPADDPQSGNQGYLDPAPDGIDAEFAWPRADGSGFAGGDGAGISVIDLEQGWTLDHEDLAAHGATLLHGTLRDQSRAHGTSVLGELCAVDNGLGCIGIASGIASIHVVSRFASSIPDATMAAIANLAFGDVLLLEVQDTVPFAGVDTLMPSETLDANFDTIRLATALGITVVAAGDLLDFDTFRRFIRENNNATWRNFNVVEPDPSDPDAESVLAFLAVGAPDRARLMRLEVVARLPRGARIWLEAPAALQNAQRFRPQTHPVDGELQRVRIPVNPHGAYAFDEILFPAKGRFDLRLIVQLPGGARTAPYEVYARQLYAKEEVGRVTWRLVPPRKR